MEWAGPGEPTPEDLLNPLAVAASALETLDAFGGDEALKAEMEEMLREARSEMIAILNALLERLISTEDPYPQANPRVWRRALMGLTGDAPVSDFRRYRLAPPQRRPYRFDLIPRHALGEMPGWGHRQVICMFVAAVRKAVQRQANWADSTVFAVAVRDHAQALCLAWLISCSENSA
jgi:hypothetical protein